MKTVTDYSINKYAHDAIVYIDATGAENRLTIDDFDSEEEFHKWKEWSDNDYHEIEKGDHVQDKHSISMNDAIGAMAPSAEDILIRRENIDLCLDLVEKMRYVFPPMQFRRIMLHYFEGLSITQIGKIEGVSHQAASKRVHAGIIRARKLFSSGIN